MIENWNPPGWNKVKLRDLGYVSRGRSRHRPRYDPILYGGKYPFIQTGDVKESGGLIIKYSQTYNEVGLKQSKLWPTETMCITIAANIAETGILDFPACFPDSIVGFIADKNKCNVYFIEYLFRFLKYYIQYENVGAGSVQDNLNVGIIDSIEFPIPDLDIQNSITNILKSIDDEIFCLRKTNFVLEKIIQTIFKSWFVDFDGQTEFVDSELGQIPKGWKVEPAENLAEFVKGFSYKGDEKFKERRGFVFVTLNSINEGGGFKKKFSWLDSDRLKERHYLNEMDLIIANTEQTKDARLLATPAIVQFPYDYDGNIGVYSHHITRVIPKALHLKFYLYSLFLFYQKNIANAFHTGTGVWGFDQNSFQKQYLMLRPSSTILEKFDKVMNLINRLLINNEKNISILTRIRDSLLPKLMSGEIRVT